VSVVHELLPSGNVGLAVFQVESVGMTFARSFQRGGVTAAGVVKLLAEASIAEGRMIRRASGAEV
jgi:hypothetical protein